MFKLNMVASNVYREIAHRKILKCSGKNSGERI
jgi:hypothetical protein